MSHQPSRRDFLQTTTAITATMLLRRSLFARNPAPSFHFLPVDSKDSWAVADPVQWSLENAREPVLERASEGLLKLTPADGDRITRLVARRCHLNLLELRSKQVSVHHWGQQGLADLRPFFKAHGLARKDVQVVVKDRKKEIITEQPGDDFLFGDRLVANWPFALYQSKWQRRFEQQPDDRMAAKETWSGYAWEGVEDNRIPWMALKSAWLRAAGPSGRSSGRRRTKGVSATTKDREGRQ